MYKHARAQIMLTKLVTVDPDSIDEELLRAIRATVGSQLSVGSTLKREPKEILAKGGLPDWKKKLLEIAAQIKEEEQLISRPRVKPNIAKEKKKSALRRNNNKRKSKGE